MSEQISALIDDEIAVDDAEHLITSIHANKQASQTWNHYHLIGDVMRGDIALPSDFKQKLMQKIELEPTVLAPSASQVRVNQTESLKDRVPAKWSIAASFAAVMMVGWMALQQHSQSDSPSAMMEVADVSATTGESIPAEYLTAHQSSAPSTSSYYIQSVNYSE
jgi:sigma-E factor negative regulatory protein RseA